MIFQATTRLKKDAYHIIEEDPQIWKENVFNYSCELLLQMSPPDALIRLQRSRLANEQKELTEKYFFDQCHDSLAQFLDNYLPCNGDTSDGVLMQVRHLSISHETFGFTIDNIIRLCIIIYGFTNKINMW